jgi:hypothetical protein
LAGNEYAIPSKGDRIEHRWLGVLKAGLVWYADQLQVLVKWDNGESSSLRVGRDTYVVHEAAGNADVGTERGEHLSLPQNVPAENRSRRRIAARV